MNVAGTFKLRGVAVGVETLEKARLLLAQLCNHLQGFPLGHPVREPEVAAIILKDARNAGDMAATAHHVRCVGAAVTSITPVSYKSFRAASRLSK